MEKSCDNCQHILRVVKGIDAPDLCGVNFLNWGKKMMPISIYKEQRICEKWESDGNDPTTPPQGGKG